MPRVKFNKPKDVKPVEPVEPVDVKPKKKRVKKVKTEPVATAEPVEESTPAPVEPVGLIKSKRVSSPWQLHVKKTFEENKGKPFKDVMGIAKESYKK